MSTGIRDFITEMKKLEGGRVNIKTAHKLYGGQKIEMDLRIIDDESRLGFEINGQDIFIEKVGLVDFGIIEETYYFASDLMCIELKTI